MAKSTSDKTKTTKAAAEKKPAAAKADPSAEKAKPKKAATKSKASSADPAEALVNKCQEVADKLDKMQDPKYTEIKEKLVWCLGSYKHDQNPAGLVEYGSKAVDALKEAREEKPKQVSQKFIDDLQKAIAKMS